jgi:uncharacterized membrane protein
VNSCERSSTKSYDGRRRVVWGTVLLGPGLGSFFDGIVLHQMLQWHHMVTSAGYPALVLFGGSLSGRTSG